MLDPNHQCWGNIWPCQGAEVSRNWERPSKTGHRWSPKEESPPKSPLVNPRLKQRSLRFNQDLAAWYIFRDWPHMMQAKNQQVLRSSELKHFRLSLSLSLSVDTGGSASWGWKHFNVRLTRVWCETCSKSISQYPHFYMSTYGLYKAWASPGC